MDKVFILLSLLSIPSIITVPYFDGLAQDFSNLVVELAEGNQTSNPPFQILQYEPSQWAEVNISLPDENYTISFLASFQGAAPAPQNPENASLPENLPQDSFNISEENGSIITFYFNLTEGNISEQLNLSENQTVLYTFYFNLTQNGTGNETLNLTQNETIPLQPEPNITQNESAQSEPQQEQNITINESLNITQNETAEQNITLNESSNLTEQQPLIVPLEQLNLTNYTLNISWNPSLAPDFSNLLVQFVSQDGSAADIRHGILSLSPSEWALLLFERPPAADETVSLIALDWQNGSTQNNLSNQTAGLILPQNSLPDLVPGLVDGQGRGTLNGSIYSFSKPPVSNDRQFVVVKDPDLYDVGTGDFSLTAWIRSEGDQTGTIIKRGNYEEGNFYAIQLESGGTISFSMGTTDGDVELETTKPTSIGEWHHVAGVRQGQSVSIFVDGILAAQTQAPVFDLSGEGILSIGADMSYYAWIQVPQTQFWGDIRSPQVWNRALGEGEIASLYKEGKPS